MIYRDPARPRQITDAVPEGDALALALTCRGPPPAPLVSHRRDYNSIEVLNEVLTRADLPRSAARPAVLTLAQYGVCFA